jgi:hypothetical protein
MPMPAITNVFQIILPIFGVVVLHASVKFENPGSNR